MASETDSGPTLLGPLTTIFTPPASCQDLTVLSISTVFRTTITVTNTLSGGDVVSVSTIPTITTSRTAYLEKYDYILDSDCYPPGYTTYSAYYSPGRCPSAWEGVITTAQNGETTVQCCPTSFIFSGQLCRSTISETTTVPVVLYKNQLRVDPTPTPSSIPDDNVWATGIVIRYRDGDFDTTTTDAKTTVAESTAAPSDTASPSTDDSSSGLSLGGKVGLGVGIPAAALLVAVLAFLFFRRRRPVATVPGPPPQELQQYSQPPPQQYYQPMEQSLPAGYWEAKPAEVSRASEIYTSSTAGSPRPRVQSAGYAPVAQVGAYGSAHDSMGYAPTVGSEQGGYGQEARALSAASEYAPATGRGHQQDANPPTVQPQGLSPRPAQAAPTQMSSFGGPLPDPSELYPEYGAAGDDDDSLHGVRR
ncbi:hypothetical protein V492_01832 [Pseudogymnoascus sp. VKM F-4246]|nr:hypothetical protein V492_01832 [Pseudogymnoascus sp. VKM F-4246]